MPLYEYACRECEHAFEALVFPGDDEVECPECHGRRVERQLSLPARPHTETAALPAAGCDASLPPCGPMCRRFTGDD
jgi:putative FmdB family regulatory protein